MALICVFGGVNEAVAQTTQEYSFEFTSKTDLSESKDWSPSKSLTFNNYNTTYKGVQIGTSKAAAGVFDYTSTEKYNNVTTIKIKANTGGTATITGVKVNETAFSPTSATIEKNTKDINTYTFSSETPVSGTVTISFNASSAALYLGGFSITTQNTGSETSNNQITFSPASGTYAAAPNVEISATAEGSTIYYTTDGTDPSTESDVYSAAIPVTISGTTIKALAVAKGFDNATAEASYTIKPEQPVFSQGSTTFKTPLAITLSLPESADKDAEIHYAIGKTATAESDLYEGPITITGENDGDEIILHAVVVDKYGNVGTEKYCTYTYSDAIIFDFTPQQNIFGITPETNGSATTSNVDGKELTVSGVTLVTSTATGKTVNKIWSSTPCQLRIYTGNSFTISAPSGYVLSNITFDFDGSNNGNLNTSYGESQLGVQSITFTANGKQARIKTITVKIAPAPTYTLKVGATGYSTLCLDKAYTMPEGLEGAIVTVSDNILAVDYLYTEGEVVAAGMPLLIKADKAGEYTLTYTSEEGTDLKDETMMSGETDAEGMTVGAAGSKFYKLAVPEAGIGFYWGAPDGGAFKNGADKAYLVVPGTVNVQGFRFDGTTTGISGIAGAADTDAAIYTLDGRRVSSKADELPRGIYIVGGKKVIK